MVTKTESDRRPPKWSEPHAGLPDREERRVAALQRMFSGVLEDEARIGGSALERIDRAVRGDQADE